MTERDACGETVIGAKKDKVLIYSVACHVIRMLRGWLASADMIRDGTVRCGVCGCVKVNVATCLMQITNKAAKYISNTKHQVKLVQLFHYLQAHSKLILAVVYSILSERSSCIHFIQWPMHVLLYY